MVKVASQILSNNEALRVMIPVGAHGEVLEIDGDGDARIQFPSLASVAQKTQRVLSDCYKNLQVPSSRRSLPVESSVIQESQEARFSTARGQSSVEQKSEEQDKSRTTSTASCRGPGHKRYCDKCYHIEQYGRHKFCKRGCSVVEGEWRPTVRCEECQPTTAM